MFRPGGVMISCDGVVEWHNDTVNCRHCQTIMERKQRPFVKGVTGRDDPDDIGGICGGCGKPICWECAKIPECVTISERLDEYERTGDRKWLERGVLLKAS